MIKFNLSGDFYVEVKPQYIFTIKGKEFKAHDGLTTIIQKLIVLGCRDDRLLSLSRYSDIYVTYRDRALPTSFNLTMVDKRPDPMDGWYYTPWSILPGVLPLRQEDGLARKNSVLNIGNYRISPYGTKWEVYSLISGNKSLHSDLSVCVWILYNWGCIENSCSDADRLIEFCGKWLEFINSKTRPLGIELRADTETSVKLTDFWREIDASRGRVHVRDSTESPKRDSIKQRSEGAPKKRGRPRKS